MHINKKFLLFVILFYIFKVILFAQPSKAIDTPINSFYKPNEYALDYYLYREGGVVMWMEMGVKSALNLGFSVNFKNMIGDQTMTTEEPKISVRFRAYRGDLHVPAIIVGYLGQGFDNGDDPYYRTEEKGFFVSFEREIFLPYLIWNFGANKTDFKDSDFYGFINVRYFWLNKLLLMLEYDNIKSAPNARLNFGFRYYIVDNLSMGLAFRKLNKTSSTIERVFMITYVGHFNVFPEAN